MSFPYSPNVLALFNILSDRLRGTAPVHEVLRAGAAAAPGAVRPLHLALQDLQNSLGGLPQVSILCSSTSLLAFTLLKVVSSVLPGSLFIRFLFDTHRHQ